MPMSKPRFRPDQDSKLLLKDEFGTITQSRAMDNLLKMLRRNPEILSVLVEKLPDTIKLSHKIDCSTIKGSYLQQF